MGKDAAGRPAIQVALASSSASQSLSFLTHKAKYDSTGTFQPSKGVKDIGNISYSNQWFYVILLTTM